ncbi:hypothetical protein KY285_015207 [Solanum tuberosum]|nr:hypothetical protein KY285_015207 [Solanum tuberosum]
MGKPFDTFRITLKQNENNNARFQMTMVYELLKRRREFAIVSRLKCHPPSKLVPEFIVKKEPQKRKKGGKEETRQSTEEQDLMSLVGTSFKNPDLIYLLNVEDTPRKHKESLCLLWFVHNVLLAKDLNNNISLKWVNLSQDIEAFNNYPFVTPRAYTLGGTGTRRPLLAPSEPFAWLSKLSGNLTQQNNSMQCKVIKQLN